MKIVELDAENLRTDVDFVMALRTVVGAPQWHGHGPDAFIDSMIYHDDINDLKSPYTIRIVKLDRAGSSAREAAIHIAGLINEIGKSDRETDLEVRIIIE